MHSMRKATRMAVVGLGAGSVLASVALGSGVTGAGAATFTPPGYVRSVGGTGTAGVYAWGIQYDATTNQIEVADYWNFYVRSYTPTGTQTQSFYQSAATRQGQPESIAVNPLNGDIYVAENGTQKSAGYVAHFSDTGAYIGEINTQSEYTAWIAIDHNNHLFVVNGHLSGSSHNPNKVQEYDISQSNDPEINSWGTYGTGNCDLVQATGVSTDSAGHVFVADAQNYYVAEFTPSTSQNGGATCVQDIGSGQGHTLGQFVGDLRGVAVDQTNNLLYVSDAAGYRIVEFNLNNTPPTAVKNIGSQGTGNGQLGDGARQIAVDSSGDLWAADYSNFRFEEFSPSGAFMAVYPNPAEPPAPGFLSEARDVAVSPVNGTVWVANSWSDRFQEFAADGTFIGAWGHRGSTAPYGLDYPRGIGVDPNGNVWVADTRDYYIRIYDGNGNYLNTIGSGLDSNQPGSFEAPDDVTFYGGYAYVGDYWSCTMTVWTDPANPTTTLPTYVRQINGCNFGVAVDPATGNTYIVDQSRDQIREYNSSGSFITRVGQWRHRCRPVRVAVGRRGPQRRRVRHRHEAQQRAGVRHKWALPRQLGKYRRRRVPVQPTIRDHRRCVRQHLCRIGQPGTRPGVLGIRAGAVGRHDDSDRHDDIADCQAGRPRGDRHDHRLRNGQCRSRRSRGRGAQRRHESLVGRQPLELDQDEDVELCGSSLRQPDGLHLQLRIRRCVVFDQVHGTGSRT